MALKQKPINKLAGCKAKPACNCYALGGAALRQCISKLGIKPKQAVISRCHVMPLRLRPIAGAGNTYNAMAVPALPASQK